MNEEGNHSLTCHFWLNLSSVKFSYKTNTHSKVTALFERKKKSGNGNLRILGKQRK